MHAHIVLTLQTKNNFKKPGLTLASTLASTLILLKLFHVRFYVFHAILLQKPIPTSILNLILKV